MIETFQAWKHKTMKETYYFSGRVIIKKNDYWEYWQPPFYIPPPDDWEEIMITRERITEWGLTIKEFVESFDDEFKN